MTVDIAAGIALGDASVGVDTFSGVNGVRGSYFDDFVWQRQSLTGTVENFEGRGGNDYIDGRGGFDRAVYANEDTGITVHLAAGTVVGGPNTGTDTLRSIEAITGTEFADTYDASGFTTTNVNGPNFGSAGADSNGNAFNEFEGRGGNDTIIGNGNTRVAFYNATAGVTVDLAAGTSVGTAHANLLPYANVDPAGVGSDTFSGVSQVRGSEFSDNISGDGLNNTLEGQGGNDTLNGLGGNDILTGGTGADRFVYSTGGGNDIITDFDQSAGAPFSSHEESDRIDLRQMGIVGFGVGSNLISPVDISGNAVITFAGSTIPDAARAYPSATCSPATLSLMVRWRSPSRRRTATISERFMMTSLASIRP